MNNHSERTLHERASALPYEERKAAVSAIKPEGTLHTVMEQVFERMGARWVEIQQGTDEFGKDVIARFDSQFGQPTIMAVVAKLGKVYGRVGGGSTLSVVLHQVDQAFRLKAQTVKESGPIRVNHVLVVCTGTFAGNSKREITERAEQQQRRIDYWDVDVLTNQITKHLPEFFFDLDKDEHEYLQSLQDSLGDLEREMRRYGRSLNFSLDDVFIEPRLAIIEPTQRVGGTRPKRGKTKLVNVPSVPMADMDRLITGTDSLLVMGPAGSGKTTLLRKAAYELCQRRMSAVGANGRLPIWLSAAKMASLSLETTLLELVERASNGLAAPPELVARAATEDGITIIVDDMDMLHAPSSRAHVRQWLEKLATVDARIRVLAATRVGLFENTNLVANFKPAVLMPFHLGQVKQLLERILGADKAPRVLRSFMKQNDHSGLPHTPLVVTLLAILHREEERGEIPANIAELYRMVSEVYLGKWSEGEGSGLERHALLTSAAQALAYRMQKVRLWACKEPTAVDFIGKYLAERSRSEGAAEVMAGLVDSGLVTRDVGANGVTIAFSDRTFQEFFAASYVATRVHLTEEVVSRYPDPWWTNVVTFVAGLRKDSPDIIAGAVQSTQELNPEMSLLMALQMGRLLQAASLSPTDAKKHGVLHATDLLQFFYAFYARELDSARVSIKFSRTSLLLTVAVFFAMSFESRHLKAATESAAWDLLADFEGSAGDERFIRGIRAMCAGAALAAQGDFEALQEFVRQSSGADKVFFGTVAWVLEACAPDNSASEAAIAAWSDLVRSAQKMAPAPVSRKYGPMGVQMMRDDVRRLTDEPKLIDAEPKGPTKSKS